MDPDAALELFHNTDDPEEAAHVFDDLADWLAKGGFAPAAWEQS